MQRNALNNQSIYIQPEARGYIVKDFWKQIGVFIKF